MTEERFCIGTIVGCLGLDGALKLRTDTNNPDLLMNIKTVELVTKAKELKQATVRSIRFDRGLTLVLRECTDRDEAEALVGSIVYTDKSQIADLEEDEWWVKDLIGIDVYTSSGIHVGTVHDVISGANQLLEIRKLQGTKDNTALVPFVKALVPVVDMKQRRIEIVDLPGLID